MKLSNLRAAAGSTHSEKRIGRGEGSGHGGTASRGHKGAKSRSGFKNKRGFEGGQMPLHRRLPKYGFTNRNRVEYKAINLRTIEALAERGVTTITNNELYEAGLIGRNDVVKILGDGALTKKVDITSNNFSKSAIAAIEAAGGTATTL